LSHQQWTYDAETKLLKSLSTKECAAIRANPGRTHSSTRLQQKHNHVRQFAEGVDLDKAGGLVMDVVYRDGVRHPRTMLSKISSSAASSAPTDLVARHLHWEESSFPSFESPSTANAITTCGAKGDGHADDHAALQSCIDKHADVFLPKGYFRLSQTLKMNAGNRLVGLSQTHSVLMPMSSGMLGATAREPKPVVSTAPGSSATIAFVGIVSWWHLPIFTLDWGSKGGLYRNCYDTRVNECLWLNNYKSQTTEPRCQASINLTVAKAQIRGTGSFINYVNDEDILMTVRPCLDLPYIDSSLQIRS
jgi:hypothetical protein